MQNKRFFVIFAAAVAVLALIATPAAAQENKFKVFVAAGYISPLGTEDGVDLGEVTDSIEASSEVGYDFGIEWRLNKLIGFELDYLNGTHDVEFGGTKIGETDFKPLSLSLNFHLIHTNFLDFYIGPTVSYVSWGDIDLVQDAQDILETSSVPADSETAFGAQVGLDIGIGPHFAIVTGVRYLQVDITPDGDSDGLAVDPLIARVGAAWRW